MNSETASKREPGAKPKRSRIVALWVSASAFGALAGAQLGHVLVPGGAFGWSASGQSYAAFASSVAFALAISQWLALRHIVRQRDAAHSVFLLLWIPATAIGIALMILPFWGAPFEDFIFNTWLVVAVMVPGMIFLGITQWLLLRRLIPARYVWALLTIVGAAVGSIVGLRLGFIIYASLPGHIPLELPWALLAGAGIGIFQAFELVSNMEADPIKQSQPIKVQIIVLGLSLGFLILYYVYAIRVSQAIFGKYS